MRAGPALIVALALCVTPAVAQGKTKVPQGVRALEMCEAFGSGGASALDGAIAAGWDAFEDEAESPFIKSYSGGKDLPGIGYADFFALVESYPELELGYCRIDVVEVTGDATEQVQAIQSLDRYEGDSIENGDGIFASLAGKADDTRLLMAHADETSFVIQLSIIASRAETAK